MFKVFRKFIIHPIEGFGVFLFTFICWFLPFDIASSFGGWIARVIGIRIRKYYLRTERNLRAVFPEKRTEEIACIIRCMWENLGRVCAEYIKIKNIKVFSKNSKIEVVGLDIIEQLKNDNKPGILFGAHLANWELVTLAAIQANLKLSQFYRPANNLWVNLQIRRKQKFVSSNLIAKGARGGKQAYKILQKGGHIAMLVDQKENDGISVPFLGMEAMTTPSVARWALRFRCPLVPVQVERIKGTKFRVTYHKPLCFPETGNFRKDFYELTKDINLVIEKWIRKRPEQWLWIHQRWSLK